MSKFILCLFYLVHKLLAGEWVMKNKICN